MSLRFQNEVIFRNPNPDQPKFIASVRTAKGIKNACVVMQDQTSQLQRYISLEDQNHLQNGMYAINDFVYVDQNLKSQRMFDFVIMFYSYNCYLTHSSLSIYQYSNALKSYGFRYRSFSEYLNSEMQFQNKITGYPRQATTLQQRDLIDKMFVWGKHNIRIQMQVDKLWIDQFARIVFNNDSVVQRYYLSSFAVDEILNEDVNRKELFVDIFNYIFQKENRLVKNNLFEGVDSSKAVIIFFLRYPNYQKNIYSQCLVELNLVRDNNEVIVHIYKSENVFYDSEQDRQYFSQKIKNIVSQLPLDNPTMKTKIFNTIPKNPMVHGHVFQMCILLLSYMYKKSIVTYSFEHLQKQQTILKYIMYNRFFTPMWINELIETEKLNFVFPPSVYNNTQNYKKKQQVQENTLLNYQTSVQYSQQYLQNLQEQQEEIKEQQNEEQYEEDNEEEEEESVYENDEITESIIQQNQQGLTDMQQQMMYILYQDGRTNRIWHEEQRRQQEEEQMKQQQQQQEEEKIMDTYFVGSVSADDNMQSNKANDSSSIVFEQQDLEDAMDAEADVSFEKDQEQDPNQLELRSIKSSQSHRIEVLPSTPVRKQYQQFSIGKTTKISQDQWHDEF